MAHEKNAPEVAGGLPMAEMGDMVAADAIEQLEELLEDMLGER